MNEDLDLDTEWAMHQRSMQGHMDVLRAKIEDLRREIARSTGKLLLVAFALWLTLVFLLAVCWYVGVVR